METAGQWLEKALLDLCRKTEGLDLDGDLISGLVSYCDLAPPLDAKEYLDIDAFKAPMDLVDEIEKNAPNQIIQPENQQIGSQNKSKKKKSGKVISLAEASKGSIIFQKGKPCSCEARRHRLVSNYLSCGKIVCEQEGEGPCSFCGALVAREGSTYAGLEEEVGPMSDAEATAEAYAKRLVDYDRNSAARTTVIDDQSDYYEMEGNTWLSMEEKELLRKKKEEIEEAERANRSKVVISFDLVGRKDLTHPL
ncbi:hypothetical protein L1987_53068 [Smallanthus sonchifolius]|uniref:Uncharacterized protein n=1 Tax=Smallanthus sonchifolius TaxID=185202 RepID=A0ACB9EV92_9ASTR|nr:hypothetical protein L1987_53068 [Smallanthus sonchifolius]